MKQWLGDLLKPAGEYLLSWIVTVPMWTVRLIFLGILAVLAVWVLTLPPQYPDTGTNEKKAFWRDLRFFAIGVLVLQSLFYIVKRKQL